MEAEEVKEQGRADRWLERVRERKELHRRRGRVYRVSFGFLGGLLILLGAVLTLPGVPGPGILLMAVGLGMLALEFDRAERLLERILRRLDRAGEKVDQARPWQKALLVGAGIVLAGAALAAVLFWDVPFAPYI